MAKLAVIFFAALAFHAALAAPKGKGAEKTQVEQLTDQVQHLTDDITATLQKNLPDTKDVTQALTTQSQEFAHNMEGILKKFQTEIDNNKGKTDDLLKQVSGKLSEAVTSLQQLSGPEATAKSSELRTQLEANIKSAAAEFEKLGKAVEPSMQQAGDSFNTFARGVLDDFVKAAENFQTQVKTAVDKN